MIPSKFKYNTPDCGYDIALIGLSISNQLIVDSYNRHKNKECYDIWKTNNLSFFDNSKKAKDNISNHVLYYAKIKKLSIS